VSWCTIWSSTLRLRVSAQVRAFAARTLQWYVRRTSSYWRREGKGGGGHAARRGCLWCAVHGMTPTPTPAPHPHPRTPHPTPHTPHPTPHPHILYSTQRGTRATLEAAYGPKRQRPRPGGQRKHPRAGSCGANRYATPGSTPGARKAGRGEGRGLRWVGPRCSARAGRRGSMWCCQNTGQSIRTPHAPRPTSQPTCVHRYLRSPDNAISRPGSKECMLEICIWGVNAVKW
jgi:hypothetical protein